MLAYSARGRRLGDSSTIGDTSFRDLFKSDTESFDQKWILTVHGVYFTCGDSRSKYQAELQVEP